MRKPPRIVAVGVGVCAAAAVAWGSWPDREAPVVVGTESLGVPVLPDVADRPAADTSSSTSATTSGAAVSDPGVSAARRRPDRPPVTGPVPASSTTTTAAGDDPEPTTTTTRWEPTTTTSRPDPVCAPVGRATTVEGPGVWLLPFDGGVPRPAHHEPSEFPGPAAGWSGWVAYTADGARYANVVLHTSWGGGGYTTVRVGEVGGPAFQVETSTSNVQSPVWSPDGNRLAYFGQARQTGAMGLYVYDVERRAERLVWAGSGASVLEWTPDGRHLVRVFNHPEPGVDNAPITAESGIWLIEVDTGEQRRVVADPVIEADLSPDGRRLVFSRHGTYGVWVVDIDGTNRRRLSDDGHTPLWSPDGKLVAYRTSDGTSVVDHNGTGDGRFLTPHKLMGWTPDPTRLLTWGEDDVIYAVGLDGCEQAMLTRLPIDHEWLGWGPDGTVVLMAFERVGY